MWTKRYIFNPTKDEYFKTKHPIATSCMLIPMLLYYLIITFGGADNYNWWLMVGLAGCLILGIGLGYSFAIRRKIYKKTIWPFICIFAGVVFITVSLVFVF